MTTNNTPSKTNTIHAHTNTDPRVLEELNDPEGTSTVKSRGRFVQNEESRVEEQLHGNLARHGIAAIHKQGNSHDVSPAEVWSTFTPMVGWNTVQTGTGHICEESRNRRHTPRVPTRDKRGRHDIPLDAAFHHQRSPQTPQQARFGRQQRREYQAHGGPEHTRTGVQTQQMNQDHQTLWLVSTAERRAPHSAHTR